MRLLSGLNAVVATSACEASMIATSPAPDLPGLLADLSGTSPTRLTGDADEQPPGLADELSDADTTDGLHVEREPALPELKLTVAAASTLVRGVICGRVAQRV